MSWIKKKCVLCNKRDSNVVNYIFVADIYNRHYYYYHQDCLDTITDNPTAYSHKQVDWAITIHDRINDHAKQLELEKQKFYRQCDKLVKISKLLRESD